MHDATDREFRPSAYGRQGQAHQVARSPHSRATAARTRYRLAARRPHQIRSAASISQAGHRAFANLVVGHAEWRRRRPTRWIRAIGSRPDGRPWTVGVADPDVAGHTEALLPIVDRAVSTSGGYGFQFGTEGRFNHLFDPRTGGSAHNYRSVTTVSPNATAADALSTAFSLMPKERIRSLLRMSTSTASISSTPLASLSISSRAQVSKLE